MRYHGAARPLGIKLRTIGFNIVVVRSWHRAEGILHRVRFVACTYLLYHPRDTYIILMSLLFSICFVWVEKQAGLGIRPLNLPTCFGDALWVSVARGFKGAIRSKLFLLDHHEVSLLAPTSGLPRHREPTLVVLRGASAARWSRRVWHQLSRV